MGYLFAGSSGAGDGIVACFRGKEKTFGSLLEYLSLFCCSLLLFVISSASIYSPDLPPHFFRIISQWSQI